MTLAYKLMKICHGMEPGQQCGPLLVLSIVRKAPGQRSLARSYGSFEGESGGYEERRPQLAQAMFLSRLGRYFPRFLLADLHKTN